MNTALRSAPFDRRGESRGDPARRPATFIHDPRLALNAPLPPEEFERALQLRMPDQKAPKPEDNDPCRSLLKALGIFKKKSASKKESASRENVTEKKRDVRPTDAGSERYFVSGEPAEE